MSDGHRRHLEQAAQQMTDSFSERGRITQRAVTGLSPSGPETRFSHIIHQLSRCSVDGNGRDGSAVVFSFLPSAYAGPREA